MAFPGPIQWFLLAAYLLGASPAIAERRGSHSTPADQGVVPAASTTPPAQPNPPQAQQQAVETLLSRQQALVQGLRDNKLSSAALDQIVRYAENNPTASKERFAELVEFAAQARPGEISDQQKIALKQLYEKELGGEKNNPGQEFASAARLVRQAVYPSDPPLPLQAPQLSPDPDFASQLSGKTVGKAPTGGPAFSDDVFKKLGLDGVQKAVGSQLAETKGLLDKLRSEGEGKGKGKGEEKGSLSDKLKDAALLNALKGKGEGDGKGRGRGGRGSDSDSKGSGAGQEHSAPPSDSASKDDKLGQLAKALSDRKGDRDKPRGGGGGAGADKNNGSNDPKKEEKKDEKKPFSAGADKKKKDDDAPPPVKDSKNDSLAQADQPFDPSADLLAAAKGMGGKKAKPSGGGKTLDPIPNFGGGGGFGGDFGFGGGGGGGGGGMPPGGGDPGGGGGGAFGDVFSSIGNEGGGGGAGQGFSFVKPVEYGSPSGGGGGGGDAEEGIAEALLSGAEADGYATIRQPRVGLAAQLSPVVSKSTSTGGRGWVLDYLGYAGRDLCTGPLASTIGLCQSLEKKRLGAGWRRRLSTGPLATERPVSRP